MIDKSEIVDYIGAVVVFGLLGLGLFDGVSSRNKIRVIEDFSYRGQPIQKVCQDNRWVPDGVPYFRFKDGARFNFIEPAIVSDDGRRIKRD